MTKLDGFRLYLTDRNLSAATIKYYTSAIKKFCNNIDPATCTADELCDTVRAMTSTTKHSSKTTYIYALRAYFAYLVIAGVRADNPADRLQIPKTPTLVPEKVMSEMQWRRFVSFAKSPRDKALFYVLGGTGLRVSEALSLTVGDITPDGLLLVMGKGSKQRKVALPEVARKVVAEYAAAVRREFEHMPGALGGGADRQRLFAMDPSTAYRIVADTGKRAGIKAHCHPHGLRHMFATWALQSGVDMITLANTLGHSSLETTRRYISTTDEQRFSVADKINAVMSGRKGSETTR